MEIIAVTCGLLSLRTAALIYFCPQLPVRLKKNREIGVIIKILKTIGQIVSLIVQGVADRKKCCGS